MVKYKLVWLIGFAMLIIGIISLTILLYVEYILNNPIDSIGWFFTIVWFLLGIILFAVGGTFKENRLKLR